MKVFMFDTVKLILNTGMDISSFTTYLIKYESPTNVTGVWTAALNGSSNLCLDATVQFDEKGIWKVQAYVAKPVPARHYHGKWADVRVFEALADTTTAPPTTPVPTTTLTTGAPTTAPPTTVAPTT